MYSVDSGDKIQTRTCEHRRVAVCYWVRNDGKNAPILYVEGCLGPSVISLTNQVIRVSCPTCFADIRRFAAQKLEP